MGATLEITTSSGNTELLRSRLRTYMEFALMPRSGTGKVPWCTCGVATLEITTSSGNTQLLRGRLRTYMVNALMPRSGTGKVARCTCGVATLEITTSSGITGATSTSTCTKQF